MYSFFKYMISVINIFFITSSNAFILYNLIFNIINLNPIKREKIKEKKFVFEMILQIRVKYHCRIMRWT